MATYDLVMIGILLVAAVLGAIRGMAWQLAPIASLVLGFLIATRYEEDVSPYMPVEEPLNDVLSMLLIYVVVSLVIYLAATAIRNQIEALNLGEYDRHLGMLFGLVKGGIFCMILTFFLVAVSPRVGESISTSHSGMLIATVINNTHNYLPEKIHVALSPFIHSLDHTLDPNDIDHHDHLFDKDEDNQAPQLVIEDLDDVKKEVEDRLNGEKPLLEQPHRIVLDPFSSTRK